MILPILTVINLIFTMMFIINWPEILTYSWYTKIINSLNIQNNLIYQFFMVIPLIIILVPIFILMFFLEI